ncbi:MAG: DinB family protein, partial [Pyrinomonadaceae bacterium]
MISRQFENLVEFLQQTPERIRVITAGLSEPVVALKNSESEFSILEHVCHLRDIEAEAYASRMKRILKEDGPLLPDIDGSRLAIERDYNSQSLTLALKGFSQVRALNVETIRNVSEDQLSRKGNLEGVGTITLWQLLALQREHDEDHLQEL